MSLNVSAVVSLFLTTKRLFVSCQAVLKEETGDKGIRGV